MKNRWTVERHERTQEKIVAFAARERIACSLRKSCKNH